MAQACWLPVTAASAGPGTTRATRATQVHLPFRKAPLQPRDPRKLPAPAAARTPAAAARLNRRQAVPDVRPAEHPARTARHHLLNIGSARSAAVMHVRSYPVGAEWCGA